MAKTDWDDKSIAEGLRVKGDKNLYFFVKEICEFGINPDPNGPRVTEDQKELCDWLQSIYEGKTPVTVSDWLHMVLTPRDTLKSTVLQGFALWIAVKNPDVRMLFYGEVHEQAQKRIAVIKRVITSCETFKLCYGSLDGSVIGLPWNEDISTIRTRTNTSIREGTFETAGLDVVVNSRHYDWIFPDDLHSERNTKTKDQIEGVAEKVKLLMPLLNKGGHMIFAGVFWNDADFHTRIIAEKNPHLFLRDVYADGEVEKDGEMVEGPCTISRYPRALPIKELEKKKGFMTADQFSCHYRLNPVSKDSQKFKKEYFALINDKDFDSVRTFLLIDPAGDPTSDKKERRDSDFYGMVVIGINPMMDILLRNMFMERCNPTEAIEAAIWLILRYNPYIIGIEKTGLGNMRHYLEEELRKRKRFAVIQDLTPGGRSKYSRVVELEPLARRHKIFIANESDHKEDFMGQITKVTSSIKSKYDDLIDPTAYILDLLKSYGIGAVDSDQSNVVPPEYQHLDAVSRDYWMAVKRAKERKNDSGFADEFVREF